MRMNRRSFLSRFTAALSTPAVAKALPDPEVYGQVETDDTVIPDECPFEKGVTMRKVFEGAEWESEVYLINPENAPIWSGAKKGTTGSIH